MRYRVIFMDKSTQVQYVMEINEDDAYSQENNPKHEDHAKTMKTVGDKVANAIKKGSAHFTLLRIEELT